MIKLKNKKLLITGIGGFIGLRAAEMAREKGMDVRGLEISPEKARIAQDRGFQVLIGDVNDAEAGRRACEGRNIVLHTAAVVKEGGSLGFFRRVNVDGSRMVAIAAKEAGASMFTQLSSVMVYGFDFPPNVAEEGPYRGENNPYCITKIESEAAVLELNAPPKFGVIIIRPGDVYGPGSIPWVQRPLELMHSGKFALVDGGNGIMNHVYVDNLVDGIMRTWERKTFGEAFNITDGGNTTFAEYFNRLADLGGAPRPRSAPKWLVKAAAGALYGAVKLIGREPELHPGGADFVTRPHAYSIEKARRLLKYEPKIDLDEGFRRTGEWLNERHDH